MFTSSRMIRSLEFIAAQLRLDISTTCHHLRTRAYAQNSQGLLNAMSSMIFYQILVDELSTLLHAYQDVANALQKFLIGERYDTITAGEQESIYAYCLRRFNGDLALGSATPELMAWVASYADRNQTIRKGFNSFFPDVSFKIADVNESGAVELRDASEEEKFKSNTEDFLREIEHSNALAEFNQLMEQVRILLEQQAPVADILLAFKSQIE